MSIDLMTLVWKHYPQGGSELILALALADIAQDDGSRIYPSVEFMANKTRMSERNVQYLLARMIERGILIVVRKGGVLNGVNYTTKYRIDVPTLTAYLKDGVQSLHHPLENDEGGVQPSAGRGAKQRIKGVKPVAPNPSLSVKIRTPDIENQGQNQPAGKACAKCGGDTTTGTTRMRIGDVCNACREDYMAGKWKLEAAA